MRSAVTLLSLVGITCFGASCGGSVEQAQANSNSANVLVVNANVPAAVNDANLSAVNGAPLSVGNNNVTVSSPVARPAVQTAPEDSEFTIQLTDVGIETRTFKNHPQLAKVEKRIEPGKDVIKIHLKNGKVVEVPGDKLGPIKTETTTNILAAAGLKPPAAAAPPQSTTKEEAIRKEKSQGQ
jgi:hypothetical protein